MTTNPTITRQNIANPLGCIELLDVVGPLLAAGLAQPAHDVFAVDVPDEGITHERRWSTAVLTRLKVVCHAPVSHARDG